MIPIKYLALLAIGLGWLTEGGLLAKSYRAADYVIIGAGTAGATLAKKLTDDKKTSVIVIHDGKNLSADPLIKYSKNAPITVLDTLLEAPSPIDPAHIHLPDPVKKAFQTILAKLPPNPFPLYQTGLTTPQIDDDERQILWVVALPEGGASAINAGVYCRGTNQVYAQWEAIAGPNWSVDRINRIYRQLEDFHGQTTHRAAHGYHGPISIRQVQNPSLLSQKFAAAVVKATGFPFVLDYNDPQTPIGASTQMQLTQRGANGRYRVSSATAFLNDKIVTRQGRGVNGRKLRILYQSSALNALWEGNKAIGVHFTQNNKHKWALAKRGVISCAGLKSSTFLLHSGIGPASQLQALGIPVIFDNPNVGQQLADQPLLPLLFAVNPADAPEGENSIFSQISFLPAPGGNPTVRQLRLSVVSIIPGLALALLDLNQPKSRGSITIDSANPQAAPVVDLGEFSNSQDMALYRAGLQIYVKDIAAQLHSSDPQYTLLFPDSIILNDIILLTEFIKQGIQSSQVFQSHCRMAPLQKGGVVDSHGRVYGVRNLFVADNSIVPQPIDGTTMASAYLIAANIAALLQREHKSNKQKPLSLPK